MKYREKDSNNKPKEYSIGLDIGTSSVGWAVVGEDHQPVKYKGQSMWGSRLFDEANTAENRRIHRSLRRRMARKKRRLKILRNIFDAEMKKKDPMFFERMKYSMYHVGDKKDHKNPESKSLQGREILFPTRKENVKYYKDYPTIYHLRSKLFSSKEKADIRELYLAVHHIMKNRGNFLHSGDVDKIASADNSDDLKELLEYICRKDTESEYNTSDYKESNELRSTDVTEQVKEILLGSGGSTKKSEQIQNELKSKIKPKPKSDEFKKIKDIFSAIAGSTLGLSKLFNLDASLLEANGLKGLKFSDSDKYEEKRGVLLEVLDEEEYELLELMERVYQWAVYSKFISKNKGCLSGVMVDRYEAYKKDLKDLKELYSEISEVEDGNKYNKEYQEFFIGDKKKAAFNELQVAKDIEKLYKKIEKDLDLEFKNNKLSDTRDDKRLERYEERRSSGEFLLPLRTYKNGTIPRQIHQYELNKILKNQAEHYEFLLEKDSDGFSGMDKIIKTFEFKIPYYVGPLKTKDRNGEQTAFGWSTKSEEYEGKLGQNGKEILPWNFEEAINKDESAKKFIDRMRLKCGYLLNEETLPKNSPLYQEFELRNELKNLKITSDKNTKSLTIDQQEAIYKHLANGGSKSLRKIRESLSSDPNLGVSAGSEITGTSDKNSLNSSLSTEVTFNKLGVDRCEEVCVNAKKVNLSEYLAEILTVFEDSSIVKSQLGKIEKLNGDKRFTEYEILKLKNIRLRGWGRLSRKLLDGLTTDYKDGKNESSSLTLINVLRNSRKDNFMKIISYPDFAKKIMDENKSKEDAEKFNAREVVFDLPGSPALKRGIWQAYKIIDEVDKIMQEAGEGRRPKRICIEMARSEMSPDEIRKLKGSRKKQIKKVYEEIIKDESAGSIVEATKSLSSSKDYEDVNLSKEKFFLYYLQSSKCAYCAKGLNIDAGLPDTDVDHIIPRSLKKDDSLNNKVLVHGDCNRKKADSELVPEDVRKNFDVKNMWSIWKKNGAITLEKYKSLTRYDKYSDPEKSDFIARQLVETRQITKHVANILQQKYKCCEEYPQSCKCENRTDIVLIRSGLVSEFRDRNKFIKCREINDLHHAKDAYITAIMGDYVINTLGFGNDVIYGKFVYKSKTRVIDSNNDDEDKESAEQKRHSKIIRSMSWRPNADDIWKGKESLDVVCKVMKQNDCLVAKRLVTHNDGIQGGYQKAFFDQNLSKKSSGLVSRREGLQTNLYGGYSKEQNAYMVGIEFKKGKKGNKLEYKIVNIPIHIAKKYENNVELLTEYLSAEFKDPKIITKIIGKSQKITKDGQKSLLRLLSASEYCNARPLLLDHETERGMALALKYGYKDPELCEKEFQKDKNKSIEDAVYSFFEVYIKKLEDEYDDWSNNVDKIKSEYHKLKELREVNKLIDLAKELIKTTAVKSGYSSFTSDRRHMKSIYLDKITLIYESTTGLKRREVKGSDLIKKHNQKMDRV